MKKQICALLTSFLFFITFTKAAISINFSTVQTSYLINPPYVSGVINDPIDPAATLGIKLDVTENNVSILAADYTITITSSKTSVVTVANVVITKFDGYCIAQITPTGVGYSDIKITLKKGSSSDNITIKYAASAASSTPSATKYHTGISDASAAIALDTNYMLVGDDEINSLMVYDRKKSGLPIKTFDYQNLLGLTDGSSGNYKEIDLEGGVRSPNISNRIYWISSLGTAGSSNSVKANINRLFATDVTGSGVTTSISVVGYYNDLRNKLIAWGDSKGYSFTTSAAAGHDSKTIDGFNIEGLCFAPNNADLWIGFRAPLVPVNNRTKALIAPIVNFENWFNNGTPSGSPTIGNPIELNLNGRGIRDIIRLSNGVYIIVAGSYDTNPNGAIFKWTGNASDTPVLISDFNVIGLNAEAVVEIVENNVLAENKIEIISDNGSFEFYNDGTEAKDLSQNNYKKFRSDLFVAPSMVLPNEHIDLVVSYKNNKAKLAWFYNYVNIKEISIEKSNNGIAYQSIFWPSILMSSGEYFDEIHSNKASYYRLKLTMTDGKIIHSKTVSIAAKKTQEFIISPNPTHNTFVIENNELTSGKITVTNLYGKQLLQQTLSLGNNTINCSHLAKGMYLISITTEQGKQTQKVVVE